MCLPIPPPRPRVTGEILNYIIIECQFKYYVILLILALVGCSSDKVKKREDNLQKIRLKQAELYRQAKFPSWLKVPSRFSFRGEMGAFLHHNFFDELPSDKSGPNIINTILLTPKKGQTYFGFDLVSGVPYKKSVYCSYDDLSGNYGSSQEFPDYSLGIVPRVLDILGRPLKTVVFGSPKEPLEVNSLKSVKVVGGLIEESCEIWPCGMGRPWLTSLILVAVFLEDEDFGNIDSIFLLKERVDWDKFKAFLENGRGVHVKSLNPFRAYKIKGEIGPGVALKKSLEMGHIFSAKELFSMRTACHKLYDYVWNSVRLIRGDKEENLKIWVKALNREGGQELQKDFQAFFYHFLKNYGKRYNSCLKYVRGSNINHDRKRHWFFAYFNAFFHVQSLGQVHICPENLWTENFYNPQKKSLEYNFFEEIKKCNGKELDYSFIRAITKLKNLGYQGRPSFKYLAYDSEAGGSHEKIYSWVAFSGLDIFCSDKSIRSLRAKRWTFGFPRDISWKNFY